MVERDARRPWTPATSPPLTTHVRLAARIRSLVRDRPAPPAFRGDLITFGHPWRTRRKGARTGQVLHLGTGTHVLRRLAPDEAPVIAELRTVEGTWLPLRSIDGVPLRPVLSPGSWEPVPTALFARAVVDLPFWRDNPFVTSPEDVPLHAYCGSSPPANTDSVAAMEAARREAVARVGSLYEIDGVVHRTTGPLDVALVRSTDVALGPERDRGGAATVRGMRAMTAERRVVTAWALPGLRVDSSQSTRVPWSTSWHGPSIPASP